MQLIKGEKAEKETILQEMFNSCPKTWEEAARTEGPPIYQATWFYLKRLMTPKRKK